MKETCKSQALGTKWLHEHGSLFLPHKAAERLAHFQAEAETWLRGRCESERKVRPGQGLCLEIGTTPLRQEGKKGHRPIGGTYLLLSNSRRGQTWPWSPNSQQKIPPHTMTQMIASPGLSFLICEMQLAQQHVPHLCGLSKLADRALKIVTDRY